MSDEPSGYFPSDRAGPRSSTGVLVLTIGLILALAMNLVLAVRLDDERRASAALEEQVRSQQEQIDRLRAGGRTSEGDPLAAIRDEVERIRELRFTREVRAELLTIAQLRARVERMYRKETSRAEVGRTQSVLEAIGVVREGIDLYDLFIAAQTEQVAGFYDPERKRMFVGARDATDPAPIDQVILAHEYTHAVTDQRFGLDELQELQDERDDDAATALLCLTEGDAQFVASAYSTDVLTPEDVLSFGDIESDAFSALPEFVQGGLLAPYTAGLEFVGALHSRGGWDLVNDAYDDPPASTEQVLHPARYTGDRDDPVDVDLPDVRDALGAGWRQIDRGIVGELDLRLIADLPAAGPGLSREAAERAADGWDGGSYVGLRSDAGPLVAMLTVWDSEAEATEAEDEFGAWLPLRYGNVGSSRDVGPRGRGWTSDDGAGVVMRDGGRVLFVFGPNPETVDRARAAFDGF